MQQEIIQPGPLLDKNGNLAQVGWCRFPLLDCNLENASFYAGLRRPLQAMRIKRWDYYAIFTPFKERVARTNLLVISSEVHQMLGHYAGEVIVNNGETIYLRRLVGFAEEHYARW